MRRNNPLQRFLLNPSSRAYAIKAKCAECVGCTPDHPEMAFGSLFRLALPAPAHCIGFGLIRLINLWKAKKRLIRTYDRQCGESCKVEALR